MHGPSCRVTGMGWGCEGVMLPIPIAMHPRMHMSMHACMLGALVEQEQRAPFGGARLTPLRTHVDLHS